MAKLLATVVTPEPPLAPANTSSLPTDFFAVRLEGRRTEARINRGKVEINGVALDPGAREVTCDGKPVEVTTLEFDILEQLMRNAGRVVSRDGLMESLYNRKATPFDRSIDMHVSHLRRKLESSRPVIKTIRGVGYQFCQSPEDAAAV